MKLAFGLLDLCDETLTFVQQLGVRYIKIGADKFMDDDRRGVVHADRLGETVERLKKHDISIGVALLPQEENSQHWNVRLGRPERDAEMDDVCRSLEVLGRAGVPTVEYVFNLCATFGVRSGAQDHGRGGAALAHFNYDWVKDMGAPTPEREASAEQMWERIEFFLKRAIPAAEAAEVRLACHPNDPPVPYLCGEDRVLGSIEGMKRLIETVPSPSNGLNFCQGTVQEMGADVIEAIRYFGSRDKINHIHFRNVRGKIPYYEEVFIDEGEMDMVAALRAYKEVGYTRTIIPDHSPRVIDDTPWGHRGRAFAVGYIRALMHALDIEAT